MPTITHMKSSAPASEPVPSTQPVSLAERWADRRAEAQIQPSRGKKSKRDAADAGPLPAVVMPPAVPPALISAHDRVRNADAPSGQRPAQKLSPGGTPITVPVDAESVPRRAFEAPAAVTSPSSPAVPGARAWSSSAPVAGAAPAPVRSQPVSAVSQLAQPQPAPVSLQSGSVPHDEPTTPVATRAEDAATRTGAPVTSAEPVLAGLPGVSAVPTERTASSPALPSALPSAQTAPPIAPEPTVRPTASTPPSPAGITVPFPSWGQGHEVRAQWLPSGVVLTPSSERVGLALAAAPKGALNEISQWHVEQTDPDGARRDQRRQREHDGP